MGFKTIEESKPATETQISDDGNFKLSIDPSNELTKYGITVLTVDIYPGFGWGSTIAEALKKSRASLRQAACKIQDRLVDIDKMIAEEESKGSED